MFITNLRKLLPCLAVVVVVFRVDGGLQVLVVLTKRLYFYFLFWINPNLIWFLSVLKVCFPGQ